METGEPRWGGRLRKVLALGVASLACLALGAAISPAFAPPPPGPLTQLSGSAGCVAETGSNGCADGFGLNFAAKVALSPDGKSAYVSGSDALTVFDRDPSSGQLSQKPAPDGCISDGGTGGCTSATALASPGEIAVSPDGASVYVTSFSGGSVAVFDRDPASGKLTQKPGASGCLVQAGGRGCTSGRGLYGASDVVVSPDGNSVYVTSGVSHAVAVFDRDPASGKLTQKAGADGCIQYQNQSPSILDGCADSHGLFGPLAAAVSGDGKSLYVAYFSSDAIGVFDRNLGNGKLTQKPAPQKCVSETGADGCANGKALDGVADVTVSSDGKSVYAAGYNSGAVDVFDREPVTGVITQKSGTSGCLSNDGSGGACADGRALQQIGEVALSSTGTSLYAASGPSDGAVAVIYRSKANGKLAQFSSPTGCWSDSGSAGKCKNGRGLAAVNSVVVSGDSAFVYSAAQESSAVAVFKRQFGGSLTACSSKQPSIVGTQDKDVIKGTRGSDVILGLGGRDVVRGRGDKDRICGGPGSDLIVGGRGRDRLSGGKGADRLIGGKGLDVCKGSHRRDATSSC